MKKKVLLFDQDDTINHGSKQDIDPEIGQLFIELLGKYDIVVITGTGWDVVKRSDVDSLQIPPEKLVHYHMMPTTGTQYWRYELAAGDWVRQYSNFFTQDQADKITQLLEGAARKLGYWVELPTDAQIIENRGSQITYSALGQWADVAEKKAWDPDRLKRGEIVADIKKEIDAMGLNITIGGSTSIDVTMPGIDKGYAVRQFLKATGHKMEDCLFMGDMIQPGGNDYAVKLLGVDCIPVRDHKDTQLILKAIAAVS